MGHVVIPAGVTGNTADSDSVVRGSNPWWEALSRWCSGSTRAFGTRRAWFESTMGCFEKGMSMEFPLVGEYRHCKHGYDHPPWAHSCDGCWCDDDRDKQYGWPEGTKQP